MNPNTPDAELVPPSPLCCLRFNPKNTDTLVGGSYNGLLTFYDLRKPGGSASKEIAPTSASLIEKSHHDPVYVISENGLCLDFRVVTLESLCCCCHIYISLLLVH